MKKKIFLWLAAALAMLLLSGCASAVYDEKYSWADGWREGKVNHFVWGDKAVQKYESTCKGMQAEPTDRFAVVIHRNHNQPRWSTVKLPTNTTIKVGDNVYVNVLNCREPLIARSES